jgi:NTE family protein
MQKTKIALACQGGGSQTAFTAGALKGLLESHVDEEVEVVSVSGTSGGAVCAALIWYAFEIGERPYWGRLMDFWKDNTAQTWAEQSLNKSIIESLRMVNRGLLPAFQFSPASPLLKMVMPFLTMGNRKTFSSFPDLLRKYIDFDKIAAWGRRDKRPILVVGASNVTTGRLAKFSSNQEPIRLEHVLASCAVPNIFPAVEIGEEGYWDGLFSDNPPIQDLIRPRTVGLDNIPNEIWLIKINPTTRKNIPREPDDILDRRNQLEGNISLFHQLDLIEMINDMILADAFRTEYLGQLQIKAPIRIPKSFDDDPDKPYHIPCIEMPRQVQDELDYEGKIDRSPKNIDWLIAQGEASAEAFLKQRAMVLGAHSANAASDRDAPPKRHAAAKRL